MKIRRVFSPESLSILLDGRAISGIPVKEDLPKKIREIMLMERAFRKQLTWEAIEIATEMFPIIDDNKDFITISARLVDKINFEDSQKFSPHDFVHPDVMDEVKKRKIINSITQGAGFNSHGIHHLSGFFNDVAPDLKKMYDDFDAKSKKNMGIFLENTDKIFNKKNRQSFEKDNLLGKYTLRYTDGKWKIDATALIFPVLVHEIIKGVYELISLHGLPNDKKTIQTVYNHVESTKDEHEDLFYGIKLYSIVRDMIHIRYPDQINEFPQIFEYFLQEIYQKPAPEFISIIENIIKNTCPINQFDVIVKSIYKDLKLDKSVYL